MCVCADAPRDVCAPFTRPKQNHFRFSSKRISRVLLTARRHTQPTPATWSMDSRTTFECYSLLEHTHCRSNSPSTHISSCMERNIYSSPHTSKHRTSVRFSLGSRNRLRSRQCKRIIRTHTHRHVCINCAMHVHDLSPTQQLKSPPEHPQVTSTLFNIHTYSQQKKQMYTFALIKFVAA